MTNGSNFLTKHYKGERRDLAASILFLIPFFKEMLLYLGCVDASNATANYNLKKKRSILIFVGGEKEQLMTESHSHKIFVKSRKGFVKLALKYGAHLVPMYTFGENEVYTSSKFLIGFRKWLQTNFQLGIPICWGRWGTLIPNKVPLHMEVGKPIKVEKVQNSSEINQSDIDKIHDHFVEEIKRLFDRTKEKNGYKDAILQVY
eukprot:gene4827-6763_t